MVCMESGAGGLLDDRKGDADCLAPCMAHGSQQVLRMLPSTSTPLCTGQPAQRMHGTSAVHTANLNWRGFPTAHSPALGTPHTTPCRAKLTK